MSEFDKLKGDAEQYAKDHPQQVHKAEQDAEHEVESRIGHGGQQGQGDQQDEGVQQGEGDVGGQDQGGQDQGGQDQDQQDQGQ